MLRAQSTTGHVDLVWRFCCNEGRRRVLQIMGDSDDGFVLLVTGCVDLACCFGVKEKTVGQWYVQHAAIWHWYLLLCIYIIFQNFLLLLSIPFLYFLKSGIDKSTEWSTIPACPSLMCFFNRSDTEGTNSSKILCQMFVYVSFYVNLCHDWFCALWIICGLMTCVQSKWETDWTLFLAMM